MKLLTERIKTANAAQVDGLWAILNYHNGPGIRRRLLAMAELLHLDPQEVAGEAPADDKGRILDQLTRGEVYHALSIRSKEIADAITANKEHQQPE